jgi:23S rRNA (pseudouridine1915-N3)-methyltransferase
MLVVLASVSPRGGRGKFREADGLVDEYLGRLSGTRRSWLQAESRVFPDEKALLAAANKAQTRRAELALLDAQGKALDSQAWAAWVAGRCDAGIDELWLAVGPADGWSETAKKDAGKIISLGAMTMAHELARIVAAEQIYRAWAIVEKHPYHRGH